MRDGREIGRIRFNQETVVGHEAQQRLIRPGLEGDDPGERDEPSGVEPGGGEGW